MIFIVIAKKVSFGDTPNRKKIESKLLYCLLHNAMLCLHQALATRKIVTRRDASIEKINKIWAVHFRP